MLEPHQHRHTPGHNPTTADLGLSPKALLRLEEIVRRAKCTDSGVQTAMDWFLAARVGPILNALLETDAGDMSKMPVHSGPARLISHVLKQTSDKLSLGENPWDKIPLTGCSLEMGLMLHICEACYTDSKWLLPDEVTRLHEFLFTLAASPGSREDDRLQAACLTSAIYRCRRDLVLPPSLHHPYAEACEPGNWSEHLQVFKKILPSTEEELRDPQRRLLAISGFDLLCCIAPTDFELSDLSLLWQSGLEPCISAESPTSGLYSEMRLFIASCLLKTRAKDRDEFIAVLDFTSSMWEAAIQQAREEEWLNGHSDWSRCFVRASEVVMQWARGVRSPGAGNPPYGTGTWAGFTAERAKSTSLDQLFPIPIAKEIGADPPRIGSFLAQQLVGDDGILGKDVKLSAGAMKRLLCSSLLQDLNVRTATSSGPQRQHHEFGADLARIDALETHPRRQPHLWSVVETLVRYGQNFGSFKAEVTPPEETLRCIRSFLEDFGVVAAPHLFFCYLYHYSKVIGAVLPPRPDGDSICGNWIVYQAGVPPRQRDYSPAITGVLKKYQAQFEPGGSCATWGLPELVQCWREALATKVDSWEADTNNIPATLHGVFIEAYLYSVGALGARYRPQWAERRLLDWSKQFFNKEGALEPYPFFEALLLGDVVWASSRYPSQSPPFSTFFAPRTNDGTLTANQLKRVQKLQYDTFMFMRAGTRNSASAVVEQSVAALKADLAGHIQLADKTSAQNPSETSFRIQQEVYEALSALERSLTEPCLLETLAKHQRLQSLPSFKRGFISTAASLVRSDLPAGSIDSMAPGENPRTEDLSALIETIGDVWLNLRSLHHLNGIDGAFRRAFGVRELITLNDKQQASKNILLKAVLARGPGRDMVGFIQDTCATAVELVSAAHPTFHHILMVDPNASGISPRVFGGVGAFTTVDASGNQCLLIRGCNPRGALLDRLAVASFCTELVSAVLIPFARSRGCSRVIAPDESIDKGTLSNDLRIVDFFRSEFEAKGCPRVTIPETERERVRFNGYDISAPCLLIAEVVEDQ